MTTLPGYISAYIVTALACYETPSEVANAVKERFNLVLSRQRIESYHPERRAGSRLDAKWRTVFADTRARFHAEINNIPIVHRAYRLKVLERIAHQAEEMGNYTLACHVLALAAKESTTGQAPF